MVMRERKREREPYLQLGEMLWSLLDVHPPQANADGARRDDDDLVAIFPQLHGGLDDGREDGKERLMALFVDDGARSWTCVSDMTCIELSWYAQSGVGCWAA